MAGEINKIPVGATKFLKPSIEAIESFKEERSCKTSIKTYPIDGSISTIKYNEETSEFIGKFILEEIPLKKNLFNNMHTSYGVHEEVVLKKNNSDIVVPENSVTSMSADLSSPHTVTAHFVHVFQRDESSPDRIYNRLIIEYSQDADELFKPFSDRQHVEIGSSTYIARLIKFQYNKLEFEMFTSAIKDSENKRIVIDCLSEVEWEEFDKICSAILLTIGFLSGIHIQGEHYYLKSNSTDFNQSLEVRYIKKDPSTISPLMVVDPSQFVTFCKQRERKELLDTYPAGINNKVLTNFIEIALTQPTIARTMKLLIEGNSVKNHILRSGIYSIALETVTQHIYQENQDRINPIPDKKLSALIVEELKNIMNQYSKNIPEEGREILTKKIENINSPTNSFKLKKPFELLRIKLSEKDIKTLNERNSYLHGSSPSERKGELNHHEDLVTTFHLLTLIHCLILRYANYRGHVMNLHTWYLGRSERIDEIDDSIFRIF